MCPAAEGPGAAWGRRSEVVSEGEERKEREVSEGEERT